VRKIKLHGFGIVRVVGIATMLGGVMFSISRNGAVATIDGLSAQSIRGGADICCVTKSNTCEKAPQACSDVECTNGGTPELPKWGCPSFEGGELQGDSWPSCPCDQKDGVKKCTDPVVTYCTYTKECATTCLEGKVTGKFWCQSAGPLVPKNPHNAVQADTKSGVCPDPEA
jgi:hypothetical protein